MQTAELASLTIADAAELISTKRISSTELTEAYLHLRTSAKRVPHAKRSQCDHLSERLELARVRDRR